MTSDDFQKFLARFDLQNQLMHTKHGLEGLHINGEIAAGKYPNWVKSKYAEIAKDDDVVSFEGRKEDASISGIYSNNNNNIEFYLGY